MGRFFPCFFLSFSLSLRPLFSMSTNSFVAQGLWVILKAMDLRDTEDFNAHCHMNASLLRSSVLWSDFTQTVFVVILFL